MGLKEQLLDTWQINQRMIALVIDTLNDHTLSFSSGTRSRTIFQQLAHIHAVRMQWLEICAPQLHRTLKLVDKMSTDKKELINALGTSGEALKKMIAQSMDNEGKLKGYKKGIIPFIGYLISHESHHRGNMLLTIKQNGEKIPDSLKYALWDWDKS